MTRRSPLDDPANSAHAWARYKRLMKWMGAFTLAVVAVTLALFGLMHYYLLWWGDILFLYAADGTLITELHAIEDRVVNTGRAGSPRPTWPPTGPCWPAGCRRRPAVAAYRSVDLRFAGVGGAGDLHRLLLAHRADLHRHSCGHAVVRGRMTEDTRARAEVIDLGFGGREIHLHAAHRAPAGEDGPRGADQEVRQHRDRERNDDGRATLPDEERKYGNRRTERRRKSGQPAFSER